MAPFLPTSERLVAFINAMPTGGELNDWVDQFSQALLKLVDDVDVVTVRLSVVMSSDEPESFRLGDTIVVECSRAWDDHRGISMDSGAAIEHAIREHEDVSREELRSMGLSPDEFNRPVRFDYRYQEQDYLGSITLLSKISHAPISAATIELMEEMKPFFVFTLSDAVLRYRAAVPFGAAFESAFEMLVKEAGLTDRERDVALLRLIGHTYKEIAAILSIAEATVKKHLIAAHRKGGVTSLPELFAKYFSPTTRFGPP